MGFLPTTYEVPVSSGGGQYFRPQDGDNKVRVLTDAIVGWLYWNNQNKPVRMPTRPDSVPSDLRVNDDGSVEKIKHFWAMVVLNYATNGVEIWEITQSTIQQSIASLANDADWGHPRGYDLKISRTGKGLETKYTVMPGKPAAPSKAVVKAFGDTPVDLHQLFSGGDPFSATEHSHGMDPSLADQVLELVAAAKQRGLDPSGMCKRNSLPTVPSEFTADQFEQLKNIIDAAIADVEETF